MRTLLFSFILIFFTACASLTYTYNTANNQLVFKTTPNKVYTAQLNAPKLQVNHDSCAGYSYTLNDTSSKYGTLFIEHISLESSCTYNGDALGFFMMEFKDELKLKSLKLIEQKAIKNFDFRTYQVNNESYFNVIQNYTTLDDTFIIDYKGQLYSELRAEFEPNYTSPYSDKKRFFSTYNKSLVRKNFFKGYFGRDSEDYDSH